jgi:hypothetical protein
MRKILTSALLCACLCGCGVKPGSIELPQDSGPDPFPRVYPDSATDPGASAPAPAPQNERLLTGYEKE